MEKQTHAPLSWPQGPPALRPGRAHEATGPGAHAFCALLAATLRGPVVWIRRIGAGDSLDGDGLAAFFDPARLLLVAIRRERDALWAMEEALRSGAAALAVAELAQPPDLTAGRRLQLAAEAGGERSPRAPIGLILSPETTARGSAAETRWRAAPSPSWGAAPVGKPATPQTETLTEALSWRWELLKNKRGPTGAWDLRWRRAANGGPATLSAAAAKNALPLR